MGRSRHPDPTSGEERIQHRLRSAEQGVKENWRSAPALIAGIVNTSTPSIISGTGFTVSDGTGGVGNATITFTNAFPTTPAVLLTPTWEGQAADVIIEHNQAPGTTGFSVAFRYRSGGSVEGTFHFLAIIPPNW